MLIQAFRKTYSSSVCLSAFSLNGDDPNNSSSEEAIDEEAEIDTKISFLYNQGLEYNEMSSSTIT